MRVATWSIPLLLCAACSRDVALPAPPPPDEARPVLLGPLSGLYSLGVDVEVQVEPGAAPLRLRAPIGGLGVLMELAREDGSYDVATGGLLLAGTERGVGGGSAAPACAGDELPLDRVLFSGAVVDGSLHDAARFEQLMRQAPACSCAEAGTIDATPHVAAPGLTFSWEHRVCAGGAPRPLVATRTCPFDPALSGLYVGTRTADGATEPAELALGFVDGIVYGIRHPTVTDVLFGEFDLATGRTRTLERTRLPDDCVGDAVDGSLAITAQDALLQAELTIAGDEAEQLVVTRRAGERSERCELSDAAAAGALRSTARTHEIDGARWLSVTLSTDAAPGVALRPGDERFVVAVLHPVDEPLWRGPIAEGEAAALRARLSPEEAAAASLFFPLEPSTPGAPRAYELLGVVQPLSFGAAALVSTPICVIDGGA